MISYTTDKNLKHKNKEEGHIIQAYPWIECQGRVWSQAFGIRNAERQMKRLWGGNV